MIHIIPDRDIADTEKIKLSVQVAQLVERFDQKAVSLGEILEVMQGRTYTLLLIILSIPFCAPFPIPGLSSILGTIIAIIGFRLSLGQKPWLPKRLLDVKLPHTFFPLFLKTTGHLIKKLEYLARPRLLFLSKNKFVDCLSGAMICVCGALLMLPLPIPLTNILPAVVILLLSMALLEDDGYMVVAGSILFLVNLVFFALIGYSGALVMKWLGQILTYFKSYF
ncbi:MAG: exopolysaccharide biosynthesis protein [Verrucomicrobiota bacterium]|nr:exopolysaccharide biosynthesis protein [Verrucomicrobiota bacterium]